MKIIVSSLIALPGVVSKIGVPHVIISMRGSDEGAPPELPNPHTLAVLKLTFDDVEGDVTLSGGRKFIAMKEEHARQVADFVNEWSPKVEVIVSQCNAGVCRSSAVAAAIANKFGITDVDYFDHNLYYPNWHVFKLMMKHLCGAEITGERPMTLSAFRRLRSATSMF